MFLAIDIGNTNITLGLFKFNGNKIEDKPFQIWRIATSKKKTADEYAIKILDIFYYSKIDIFTCYRRSRCIDSRKSKKF